MPRESTTTLSKRGLSVDSLNNKQRACIYARAKNLGLSDGTRDDNLHALVYAVCGKESISQLTYAEAEAVKKELARAFESCKISVGQEKKIWRLMYELAKVSPSDAEIGDRLIGIIKKVTGMDAVRKKPFAWVTSEQAQAITEMIKRYIRNAKAKKG